MTPIFNGLFDQLEIRSRDGFAFGALLRHREVLGQNDFESYIEKMDERQRNTFRILSQSYEDRDFHLSKKRPREGVSFGMIPNAIINKLLDRQNRNMRAEGAVMLMQELEQAATHEQKMDLLLPYMGSFIRFLGNLLLDASPKVHTKDPYPSYLYAPWVDIKTLMIQLLCYAVCTLGFATDLFETQYT